VELRQKSVDARVVRWALDAAERKGYDRRALCREIGVQEESLAGIGARIGGDKHVRLLQITADWPSGFEFPRAGIAGWLLPFPELAGVVCNRPSLRDALRSFLQYRELIGNVDWLLMDEAPDAVVFDYVIEGEGCSAHSAFGNFALIATLARLYDPLLQIRDAGFTGAAFAPARALRDALQAGSSFDQAHNRMVLSSTALDRPFDRFNGPLAEIHLHGAAEMRRRIRSRDSFAHAVQALLRDWLHEALDDAEGGELQRRVCECYGISRWTLRRRLDAEHTSFHELLMRARLDEARQLLQHTRLPVGEIGERVGYASISAFTRSFTRACGTAPSRYRSLNGSA